MLSIRMASPKNELYLVLIWWCRVNVEIDLFFQESVLECAGILAVVTLELHTKMYKGILFSADGLIGIYWKWY